MVQRSYRTDYPNQLHQLVVSVSKHLYPLKDGKLRYQKKNFDFSLSNVDRSEREHVVHYLVRDHFSGVFYGELCSSKSMISPEDFLMRAWSRKAEYIFCGMPDYLSIPETVNQVFPGLADAVQARNIRLLKVTSGFQSGIRDIPAWESYLRMVCSIRDEITLDEIQKRADRICNGLNGRGHGRISKIKNWIDKMGVIRLPSGEQLEFVRGEE